LNKTELLDKFVDGDLPLQQFCDLYDAQQLKGKKKLPAAIASSANLKPIREFFKGNKSKASKNVVEANKSIAPVPLT